MKNKLFYIFLAVSLIAVLILFFAFVFFRDNPKQEVIKSPVQTFECVTSVEERTVEGNSLQGIIEPEEKVIIYFGYYGCNDPERGDMVIIDYAGNKNPIIKIVKGIAGDSFSLKETGGGWNILINNEVLKNSQGREYVINQSGYRMLSLYAKDYKNKIPLNAVLVTGNLVGGSTDSTVFGLIGKDDIIGKAYTPSISP